MSIIPSEERFAKYYKQNSEKDISGVIETVQEKALQTLLDYKINKLPVHLTDICRIKGIRILKNSDAHQLREGEFGLAIKQCEKWYIVYDDTDTIQQIRFTVAHELGHLVLIAQIVSLYACEISEIKFSSNTPVSFMHCNIRAF